MGFFSNELPLKETTAITGSLVSMYDAGIPIVRALHLIRDQKKKGKVHDMLARMAGGIQRGDTLSEAFQKESRYLPRILLEAVHAGDTAGALEETLRDAHQLFEDQLAFRRDLTRILAYPIFVLIALFWIIPVVRECVVLTMTGRDDEIGPFLVRFYGGWILWLAGTYCAGWVLWRLGLLQRMRDFIGRHLWPFKPIVRDLCLSRFFRVFAITMGSGLPIKHCMYRAAQATGNRIIEKDLMQAIALIDRCATIQEAFVRSRILPPMAREMIATGENTGRGPEIWRKVANYLREDAYHRIKVWCHFMDGFLIVVIAGIIFGVPGMILHLIIGFVQSIFTALF